MQVRTYVYNSETATATARAVRDLVRERPESVEILDLGSAENYAEARRDAMLAVGDATGIGSKPDAIFDGEGDPDFSPGVLILDRETGRRELHVGEDALDVLSDERD